MIPEVNEVMEQGMQISIQKKNIPGRGTASDKTQRQKCAWNVQGRTKRLMWGERGGEWKEEGKEATGARLGKALSQSETWLLSQVMEQRNDTYDLHLEGSTWMFIEYRQIVTRQKQEDQ